MAGGLLASKRVKYNGSPNYKKKEKVRG